MGRIEVEQRDRTLVATLVNPPHALMDIGIVDELEALVQRASDEDGIGAVVLTGAHPERFIAHYDGVRGGARPPDRTRSLSLRAAATGRWAPRQ
jgi:enoyl-CoA hydratase/carnithine racemase